MDELDVMEWFEAPVGTPDQETAERVRARALARIAELDPPSRPIRRRDPTTMSRSQPPVIDLTLDRPEDQPAAGALDSRRRSPRPVVAVAGALAVLMVVAVLAIGHRERSQDVQSRLPDRSTADLVRLAGSHPDRPIGEGETLFRRMILGRPDSPGEIEVRDAWILPWGQSFDEVRWVSSVDAEPPVSAEVPGQAMKNVGPFAGYSYEQVRAMPTTVGALEDHVWRTHADRAGSDDAALALAEVASAPITPPAVRAAAVESIVRHGRLVGESTDPLGRRGLLFLGGDPASPAGPRGWAVLIDPISGLPLTVAIRVPTLPEFSWDQVGWMAYALQEVRST
ncbi:hypothetical protein [Rhabdothermincola sediminis]|uniref:hypothetical protein n=1 Tax=Rhabdothermincola sediminis TaxID=2751370 RepID=UPI001AA06884|nr:hypothetical protein [Rhabdothermincola sediminis]